MYDRPRSTLRTAFICGFLLLAFSVFAWGLRAKLSLYQHSPSSVTVAKLLITPRTGHALVSPPRATTSSAPQLVWQLSFVAGMLLLLSMQVGRRAPVPLRTCSQSRTAPPHRFSRPPPFRRRAL